MGQKGEVVTSKSTSCFVIEEKDIVHRDRRGFARLSPRKLRLMSKAASALGASKGGESIETRTANLRATSVFDWLEQPFPKSGELKLSTAAELVGVSRQCLRRWIVLYQLETKKRGTATLVSQHSLELLHSKLREEFKGELAARSLAPMQPYHPKNPEDRKVIGTRKLVTFKTAARFLDTSIGAVRAIAEKGIFRIVEVGEQTLLFRHQVEAYKQASGKRVLLRTEPSPRRRRGYPVIPSSFPSS